MSALAYGIHKTAIYFAEFVSRFNVKTLDELAFVAMLVFGCGFGDCGVCVFSLVFSFFRGGGFWCVRVCVCACVRACVRARACVFLGVSRGVSLK